MTVGVAHQIPDEAEVDGRRDEPQQVVLRNPVLEGEALEPLALEALAAHHRPHPRKDSTPSWPLLYEFGDSPSGQGG